MQGVVVLVGVSAEVGVEFDLLDREGELGFAVAVGALPDAAYLKLETLWGLAEDAVRRRFVVVRVEGNRRDLDVVGEGGDPTGICRRFSRSSPIWFESVAIASSSRARARRWRVARSSSN